MHKEVKKIEIIKNRYDSFPVFGIVPCVFSLVIAISLWCSIMRFVILGLLNYLSLYQVKSMYLIEDGLYEEITFENYPQSADYILNVRNRINREINKLVK